mmetsp:Transcript_7826/g.11977  ORF Transcript_7826/g.11977 Transcript_7826/m.11977 type:complete len:294 (+) Transcript_7826:214-1095(+)
MRSVLGTIILCSFFFVSGDARNPSYLAPTIYHTALPQRSVGFRNPLMSSIQHAGKKRIAGSSTQLSMVLDFWDPLEPLETAWELYCNRYELLDELIAKAIMVSKKNSIRALIFGGSALVVGEILARLGVIGEPKQGLGAQIKKISKSERFKEGTKERFYQKTGSMLVQKGLRRFRRLGSRSKFAISVSAGALFGQTSIRATLFCVRAAMISFFVIETMSFLGIVGEPGESILDWVEDEMDRHAGWTQSLAVFHKNFRQKLSFKWLEDMYKATVDEEKIASFGFSVGTVIALLT